MDTACSPTWLVWRQSQELEVLSYDGEVWGFKCFIEKDGLIEGSRSWKLLSIKRVPSKILIFGYPSITTYHQVCFVGTRPAP